jgi:hypothetical protein
VVVVASRLDPLPNSIRGAGGGGEPASSRQTGASRKRHANAASSTTGIEISSRRKLAGA